MGGGLTRVWGSDPQCGKFAQALGGSSHHQIAGAIDAGDASRGLCSCKGGPCLASQEPHLIQPIRYRQAFRSSASFKQIAVASKPSSALRRRSTGRSHPLVAQPTTLGTTSSQRSHLWRSRYCSSQCADCLTRMPATSHRCGSTGSVNARAVRPSVWPWASWMR